MLTDLESYEELVYLPPIPFLHGRLVIVVFICAIIDSSPDFKQIYLLSVIIWYKLY